MEFQTNPYLIWELIPGIALIGIGLYIQSRPVKKRESNVFSLLMFAGEKVTLSEGGVFDALRASLAIPIILPPWEVNGRLLVDGAVSVP